VIKTCIAKLSVMSAPKNATLPVAAALENSVPLARLLQRLQQSRERYACIRPCLPPDLQPQVRPGPLDDTHWCLLVANGAAAAKLRQLVPSFEATLLAEGWQGTSIRIKVQSLPAAALGSG
jgi:hypothetical protein